MHRVGMNSNGRIVGDETITKINEMEVNQSHLKIRLKVLFAITGGGLCGMLYQENGVNLASRMGVDAFPWKEEYINDDRRAIAVTEKHPWLAYPKDEPY